jgi:probable F420-dependent oxidoreductase
LTAAAVATESLVVGTGIALVAQRDPIQMAKEVASLDLVSNGRFYFGAGVGWLREEIANHGVDPSVRGQVVDERLRAMIAIWTHDAAEFHGEHVNFDPIHSWPKPVTRPYPPLFLGGGRAGFRRIAELGAGWMSISVSAAQLSDDLSRLRDIAGRDVPVISGHAGDPRADQIDAYRELGITHIALHLPTEAREPTLRRLDAMQAELARVGLVDL